MNECLTVTLLFSSALGLGIGEEFEDESITWTPSVSLLFNSVTNDAFCKMHRTYRGVTFVIYAKKAIALPIPLKIMTIAH